MSAPTYSAADFAQQFLAMLPTGPMWPRDTDAPMVQFVNALTPTYERICARDANLLIDAFPLAPVELLPEWELTLGLPDPCAGLSPTLQQRQQQVNARFIATGGQSKPYFIALALALGYAITITEFSPSRFGRPFGLPFGGVAWAHHWQVNAPTFTVEPFLFGRDAFGEPFATWGGTVLLCELRRLSPAHTILLFNYGISDFWNDNGVLAIAPSITSFPNSPASLAPGAVWNDGGVVAVIPGLAPDPGAAPLYFGTTTAAELQALGGGNLPLGNPGGGARLWNNGGLIAIS